MPSTSEATARPFDPVPAPARSSADIRARRAEAAHLPGGGGGFPGRWVGGSRQWWRGASRRLCRVVEAEVAERFPAASRVVEAEVAERRSWDRHYSSSPATPRSSTLGNPSTRPRMSAGGLSSRHRSRYGSEASACSRNRPCTMPRKQCGSGYAGSRSIAVVSSSTDSRSVEVIWSVSVSPINDRAASSRDTSGPRRCRARPRAPARTGLLRPPVAGPGLHGPGPARVDADHVDPGPRSPDREVVAPTRSSAPTTPRPISSTISAPVPIRRGQLAGGSSGSADRPSSIDRQRGSGPHRVAVLQLAIVDLVDVSGFVFAIEIRLGPQQKAALLLERRELVRIHRRTRVAPCHRRAPPRRVPRRRA